MIQTQIQRELPVLIPRIRIAVSFMLVDLLLLLLLSSLLFIVLELVVDFVLDQRILVKIASHQRMCFGHKVQFFQT